MIAERGLFERISDAMKPGIELQDICMEFEIELTETKQLLAEAERERDYLKTIFRREDDRFFEVRMSCKDYHFLERFSIDDFRKEEFKYRVVRAAEEMKHQIFNGLTAPLPESNKNE
jgi:hypothetical protein